MSFRLASLLRPELADVQSYVPDPGRYPVRLDANEAPALLGDATRARIGEIVARTAWERYPDAQATGIRQAFASRVGVTPEQVLVGAGSDELINLLLTALANPRTSGDAPTILTTSPTFVMYRLSAKVRGQRVVEVPLDESWDLPIASLERALELCAPNIVFVASPNNPTGTLPSRDRLERLLDLARDSLVVLDEAYVDYASASLLDLLERDNVVLLRTLSKIGFASLRVGFLIGPRNLLGEVDKVRSPYNVPAVSQALGEAVLGELWPEVSALVARVIDERERLSAVLASLPGLAVSPSAANFLWVRTARPAGEVFEALKERGVLVRSFHARGGRLASQLRITVGTQAQNDALVGALREIVA